MVTLHDPDVLFEEVAFVAYYFGWDREEVLGMSHWERKRWCEEISTINERLNEGSRPSEASEPDPRTRNGGADVGGGQFLDADDGGTVLSKSLDDLSEE